MQSFVALERLKDGGFGEGVSVKMKHSIALTAALLSCLGLSAAAQPQASTAAGDPATVDGPPKIAIVAFQAAVAATNEFQRNFADLQKKYEPKRQELKTLSDQIESLKKQLQTQGDALSDQERENRTRTINDKEKQLQRSTEDATNDFQQEMQDTFTGVASKVGEVLVAYAQQHGFTLVLDGGDQQTQTVLYHSPATDITKAVIDAYNLKSGVPAPTQQSSVEAPRPAAPKPAAPKPAAQHAPSQP
jgi:outer membrane protein